MNKIFATGRLTADPVVKTINNATCVEFTLASDTRAQKQDGSKIANFYRCSVWRQLGELCAQYLHKGDKTGIVGDLTLRPYTDTKGNERLSVDVLVTDVDFLGGKVAGGNQNPAQETSGDDLPF